MDRLNHPILPTCQSNFVGVYSLLRSAVGAGTPQVEIKNVSERRPLPNKAFGKQSGSAS